MAFIDWLRKQHADSLRASQRMAADPYLKGMQPGANVAPAPAGAIPFQRTKPGFFARDYKKDDLVKKVMIEKNDGTKEIKSEWEEPRFPVHQSDIRVSALPPEPVMGPSRELPGYPTFERDSFRTRGMGGFTGGAQRYDMGMDPGWSGVPQARAAPAPRRVQPRVSDPMNTRPGTVGGSLNHPASIANIGMPQVADLRNRIAAIDRQQAAIPRQQMPPPRFVPPVDPSQFPTISPGQIAGATYDAGDPRVQMSGGFDWSGQALRENVGEDLRGIWSPIKERMDKILEDIRKRREGQTMAPFDLWGNK
jgi:hypothetical protein